MLWQSRDEAAAGWSFRYTHRQSRWWDWVDGLCEPVGKNDGPPPTDPAEREVRSPH